MKIVINGGSLDVSELPDSCPFCHKLITPLPLYHYKRTHNESELLLNCPNNNCKRAFIAYYSTDKTSNPQRYTFKNEVTYGMLNGKNFSDIIKGVSTNFDVIYNQAFAAEQHGLSEICGVGYRKALEFLIKDYATLKYPIQKEKIENQRLAQCISEYIDYDKIKTVAKRAVWLGNDETHYVRKWENKSLSDLKTLIDLTTHWIEMEKLTENFEVDMPG